MAAFAVFCALSGVVYLINDIADREADRQHPLKRHRPIASGHLPVSAAATTAAILGIGALAAAFLLRFEFGIVASAYVALLALYSGPLKHVVIIDVLTIAIGFVLRAVAGAVVINVEISHWLLIVTVLGALFLALSKRRHELVLLADGANEPPANPRGVQPVPPRPDDLGRHRLDAGGICVLHRQPRHGAEVRDQQARVDPSLSAVRDLSVSIPGAPEGRGRQPVGSPAERPAAARPASHCGRFPWW